MATAALPILSGAGSTDLRIADILASSPAAANDNSAAIVGGQSGSAKELLKSIELTLKGVQTSLDSINEVLNKMYLLQVEQMQSDMAARFNKGGQGAIAEATGGYTKKVDKINPLEIGLFGGAIAAFLLEWTNLAEYWKTLYLPETINTAKKAWEGVKGAFTSVVTYIDELGKSIKEGFKGGFVEKIRTAIEGVTTSISTRFNTFLELLKNNPVGRFITDVITKVDDVFGIIKGVFGGMGKTLMALLKPFSSILRWLGGPWVAAALAIVDFFQGFMKKFKESSDKGESTLENIMWGVFGGITEVVRGFFVEVAELLKKMLSWVAGKLGFKEIEKFLDSFSLTDMYDNFIKELEKFIRDPGKYIDKMIEAFTTSFEQYKKNLLDYLEQSEIMHIIKSIVHQVVSIIQQVSDAINSVFDTILMHIAEIPGMEEWAKSRMSRKGSSNFESNKTMPRSPATSATSTTYNGQEMGLTSEQVGQTIVPNPVAAAPANLNGSVLARPLDPRTAALNMGASGVSAPVIINNIDAKQIKGGDQVSVMHNSGSNQKQYHQASILPVQYFAQ